MTYHIPRLSPILSTSQQCCLGVPSFSLRETSQVAANHTYKLISSTLAPHPRQHHIPMSAVHDLTHDTEAVCLEGINGQFHDPNVAFHLIHHAAASSCVAIVQTPHAP
ncbi:hypothetical protein VTO73DRAFT_9505 [Trametes versicolor]